MDMQQLEHFCAIVEHGSFTRAAGIVHMSQSALSRQIQALERELGCALFDRSVKPMPVLTPEGGLFLRFAKATLDKRLALQSELTQVRTKRKGRVRLTSPETLAHLVLPPYVQRYCQANPEVDVRILTRNTSEALSLLRTGEVDLSVILRSKVESGMEAILWRKGRYMLMVPKGHPLTEKKTVSLEDIARYRMILPHANSRISARYKFDAKMAEQGLVPDICLESDTVPLRAEYVRIGFGLCFLQAVEETQGLYPDDIDYIAMDHIFPPEDLMICMRSKSLLSPAARDFLHILLTSPTKECE